MRTARVWMLLLALSSWAVEANAGALCAADHRVAIENALEKGGAEVRVLVRRKEPMPADLASRSLAEKTRWLDDVKVQLDNFASSLPAGHVSLLGVEPLTRTVDLRVDGEGFRTILQHPDVEGVGSLEKAR